MTKKKKKNSSRKIIIGLAIAAVVLTVLGVVGKKQGWIGKSNVIAVEFAEVTSGEITETVSASGQIKPEIEVKLSPDVPGEIIELKVQEGDSVLKDDHLITIRPDNFVSILEQSQASLNSQRANLAQVKASMSQAKAQFQQAKEELDRNKKLLDDKVISQQEYLNAKTQFDVAKSNLKAAEESVNGARFMVQNARASVDQASENLSLTNIFAPMTGIVSRLSVEKGERVVGTSQMAGTEMLRIADLANMEVSVDVNENDIVKISMNDEVNIEVDAYPDEIFKGRVTSIANSAKEALGMTDAVTEFEVEIRILPESYSHLISEDRPFPFRPGMTAAVDIITEKQSGITMVPLSAVTTRDFNSLNGKKKKGGKPKKDGDEKRDEDIREVVFVKAEDNKVKMVEVKTGISDFDNIRITEGLKKGDKIISGPYFAVSKRLKEDSLVEEKKDGDDKGGFSFGKKDE